MRSKSLIVIFLFLIACKTAKVNDKTLFSVADTKVPTKEFLYVYNKNNFKDTKEDSIKELKEYLDLFVNFKLKVKEAEKQGLDTTSSFKNEFEGYRKQLVQPYLTDKIHLDSMIREAYERYKTEINASHILYPLSPTASPSDTLMAYNKIIEIRNKAIAGEDFGQLARQFSGDSSARFNQGNLGFFTSMQMVYPFEAMAYKTKVGEVSQPVRSQFGYHIIKVNETRPSQGKVQVAHLMLRTNPDGSPQEEAEAQKKIFEIYDQLKKGASWNDMVKQFSEDLNSKEKNGQMDWFGVGAITPSFENASFALNNPGDISEPIKTPYGWHIIKLIAKKPLESFNEIQGTIKSKINRESRSQVNQDRFINKLKKEYSYTENPNGIKEAQALIDSMSQKESIPQITISQKNKELFKVGNQSVNVADFYNYLLNDSTRSAAEKGITPIKDFTDKKILEYEESRLPEKHEDFRMLLKEYREGILLFTLMDENVWSKAVKDTVGLKKYFDDNTTMYESKEMADVLKISFNDSLRMITTIDSLKANGSLENQDLESVMALLNKNDALAMDFERDSLEKNNEEFWKEVRWQKGEYSLKVNGRHTYLKILDIFKPTNRNFEDIRGQVISDYQKYLEDEWIKDLKKKFPVKINQQELKRLGLSD